MQLLALLKKWVNLNLVQIFNFGSCCFVTKWTDVVMLPLKKTIDTDVEIKCNCVKKKWIKANQMFLFSVT